MGVLGLAGHDVVERHGRPARRRGSARSRSGIGSTESQSRGSRTVATGSTDAARWPHVGSAVHSSAMPPAGEPGAERHEHDLVADLDAARVDRLGQRDAAPTPADVLP